MKTGDISLSTGARALSALPRDTVDAVLNRALLSEARLKRAAERSAGLSDWGDEQYHAYMKAALSAVRQDSDLGAFGRLGAFIYHRVALASRLRLVDYEKRTPALSAEKVKQPVFIIGLFRSGTTHMHRLLSLGEGARAPLAWELLYPTPLSDSRRVDRFKRRLYARSLLDFASRVQPGRSNAHAAEWDGPEECFFLFDKEFISMTLFVAWHAYEYGLDLLDDNLDAAYQMHRRALVALQHQDPTERWVLKCPLHLWYLPSLLRAYPDARIVWMHRDVQDSLGSICSLSWLSARPMLRHFDTDRHGRFWLSFYEQGIQRGLAARAMIPEEQLIDVRYSDLIRDPHRVVDRVHGHFGIDAGDIHAKIEGAADSESKDARGAHSYALSDFGLSESSVAPRFREYTERFLSDFE